MADPLLVGIDGGASKTRAVAFTAGGAVVGSATIRSSSAYHREPEEAAAVVIEATRGALAQAGASRVATLGAGLAGADAPGIRERLVSVLTASGLAEVVFVDHDAAAALAGGTALAPGIVIISGTGSVAFGVDATGRRARAGGWGPLLDDEGSGYAIGRAALRAVMRAYDGRGETTALSALAMRRFGVISPASLKIAVRGLSIDEIASVAALAAQAASAGDAVASAILARAGERLAAMVAAVALALGWQREEFPLVTAGGLFETGALIRLPMQRALHTQACPAVPLAARFPPEVGAALLGARAAGLDTDALIRRLEAGGSQATGGPG